MKNKIYFIIAFSVICLGLTSFVVFNVDYQKTSKWNQQKRTVTGINVGNLSPDIISKTINSKKIKLSDLRGKLVIIDFWASWCKPCRLQNPHLVSIYKKYNKSKFDIGEGLEIFSVSLDKNKNQWMKAIKDDNLYWEYHVSDLKGWDSDAAFLYNIRSIPSILIIDKNGFIQAKNLRGNNLENFLKQHVVK